MIACNTAKEIEIMREACRLGREVLDEAHKACKVRKY
jgi:methionine aminopeptidase